MIPLGVMASGRRAAASYAGRVMALSPAAYWKLDETSGTTMSDSSGNNRHGTYSGAVLGEPALHAGAARSARGTAAGQGVGSATSTGFAVSQAYAVSYWVKINSGANPGGLVARYQPFTGWITWQRLGSLAFTMMTDGAQQDKYGPGFVVDGIYHITMVHDGTGANNVRFYVNGVPTTFSITGAYPGQTNTIQIGGYGGAANYSLATFSDVAYWNRALSDVEAKQLYGLAA